MSQRVSVVVLASETPNELSHQLIERNIQPEQILVVPREQALKSIVEIEKSIDRDSSDVIFLDDALLIVESLRPFLSQNRHPWVQAFVRDRIQGQRPGELLIVRADVVSEAGEAGRELSLYKALSRGLKAIGGQKQSRTIRALRGFFDSSESLEPSSSIPQTLDELDLWLHKKEGELFPPHWSERAGPRSRVFGLGLSRTGTKSLTVALHTLGIDTVHYPNDEKTFEELSKGSYSLSVLEHYDGITDITTVPYFPQLDCVYPGSRFILTTRDKESWLQSAQRHWHGRSAFEAPLSEGRRVHLELRRLLRAAVYGCYEFDIDRFSWVYDLHLRTVREYFADRPEDLLVLDICGGEGWERLCEFLDRPLPAVAFPHQGKSN